jgi:chromosome segregation ATPase
METEKPVDAAYIELLDCNQELRKQLVLEETANLSNKKKICKLEKDIDQCERYIKYLEKNLVSREDEIDQLKIELKSIIQEVEKYKYRLDLKEEALIAQDEHIINLENTIYNLRTQIYKVTVNISREMDNPLVEILARRQILSDIFYEIRRFLDRRVRLDNTQRIIIPQDIQDIINASAGNLDEIIRQANILQEVGEDQGNQIEGLQVLLDEANDRAQTLRNDLNNSRAEVHRLTQMYNNALTDERNERQHLQNVVQDQQGQIANQQGQIANQQGQINEYRRNAHRLTVRYNNDTERWRRRHNSCIQ